MSRNARYLNCSPDDVFRVLADGWLYPGWVVGASRMRDVDEAWPQAGARLHHSVGSWPLLLDDATHSLVWDPPHRMALRAKGWPLGEATVVLDVKPRGRGCVVRIQEEPSSGPGRLVPPMLADILLSLRNRETLLRLAYLAEGRGDGQAATTAERQREADDAPPEADAGEPR
ncbi:SRPBCC family protein [Microbacterium sp. LRZ72]|uniref:SRPBCC family protein n=1 Tax=Microbacterium sp. LRZ72 TaxID=2942481 RepID=UPI0029A12D1C|nr:SRPBCC family protein [Microbacterium sp. LRZ72]MDX2376700.1 SRPBCC family protein [Microbacterium sp. LRZ72]